MGNRKKNGKLRKLLLCVPILCIIAVAATFYMIFDMNKKIEDKNYSVDDIEDSNNEITNNIANMSNETEENTAENNNTNINSSGNNNNTSNTETGEPTGNLVNSTDSKEKAIELVKKEWGEDDTVLFDCYVNSNGEYIVTITSTSGKVISYYKVDLEKEQIELY